MSVPVVKPYPLKKPMRVAIVHDWLTGMRGGEAILDAICELFPEADLYTLLQTDYKMSPQILNGRKIFTSPLQKLMRFRFFRERYRLLLPFFPWAIGTFNLNKYDLILSNTHCVAKGIGGVSPAAAHLSYVSTPMRYVWDMFDDYFGPGRSGKLTAWVAKLIRPFLQKWDCNTNHSITLILANSRFVQWRVKQFWQKNSVVLHPFVELSRFRPNQNLPSNLSYFLIVSAFAPYKRIDIAIEAFIKNGLPLKIIGKGQDRERLQKIAKGANIEFLGDLTNEEVAKIYRDSEALIFPGLEDFGITPLEAMASGRPIIAYGRGGLLDTVNQKTGIFFSQQTAESLQGAVDSYLQNREKFSALDCVRRSQEFSREKFLRDYSAHITFVLREKNLSS